jgi:acyl-CoA thioester hydrolase
MSHRPQPNTRRQYRHLLPIRTRWMDNDAYAHVNNVVYDTFFDTAVNEYLVRNGVLEITHGDVIGLMVETHCNCSSPVAFPQAVCAGLRVAHLGSSSVRYETGIFPDEQDAANAQGHLLHVCVTRADRRPVPLPVGLRRALEGIAA